MKRCIVLLTVLALWSTTGMVWAGTLPAPAIVRGQYVYTIPASYDPPMIGRQGLREIQAQARGLHYPFYVVVVKDLPGKTDDDAARAINQLAEDWSGQARYDVGRSSIFLLSLNPRKYRMLAGATWKTQLGLERSALVPYTQFFADSVRGTPKDPKTGIIKLMRAFDTYVFMQIDPGRIAARKKAEQQQKLHEARVRLDEVIVQASQLLAAPVEYLPADLSAYRKTLATAKQARQGRDMYRIQASIEAVSKVTNDLMAYANRKTEQLQQEQDRLRTAEALRSLKQIGAVLLFAALLLGILLRMLAFFNLRKRFRAKVRNWREQIANAKQNYLRFYEARQNAPIPPDLSGETTQLLETITSDASAIYTSILALEEHLARCEAQALHGTVLSTSPLTGAQSKLERDFTFDAGQLPSSRLFAPPQTTITMNPAETVAGLEERFAGTVALWETYQQSLADSALPAERLFTQEKLDAMLADAAAHDIPAQWLADHPLFGDAAADQLLYAQVNDHRHDDPVHYEHQLNAMRTAEAEIEHRLSRLIAAKMSLESERLPALPTYDATVLAPQEDPKLIFANAQREEQRFSEWLTGKKTVVEMEAQAATVVQLYQHCTAQVALVRHAIAQVTDALRRAEAGECHAVQLGQQAVERVAHVQGVHLHTEAVESAFHDAQRHASTGRQLLNNAKSLLQAQRHLEAFTDAEQAATTLDDAASAFTQCLGLCDELDEQKAAYERKLDGTKGVYADAERRMRRLNRRASARLPQMPGIDVDHSLLDYAVLLQELNRFEDAVNAEVRLAQSDFSTSVPVSSSDVSSGGGFTSTDSSSGGSFSGGGDSSSGGSW